jgi:membrane protein implicated in regulation of membrane protease activity
MPGLLQFFTEWYNLPFSALLVISVLLSLLQLVGLGGEQDASADADADADGDLDGDADADTDADGDADADGDVDAGNALNGLAFLGIGKAPLAIVLAILTGATAIFGWVFNAVTNLPAGWGLPGLIVTGTISLAVAIIVTGRIARLIGRALPPVSTTVMRQQALVGRTGEVVSATIDNGYGLVRIRDNAGTMINVFAVADEGKSFQKGQTVMLASYDRERNKYGVTDA